MSDQQQTLSIPSLVLLATLSIIAIRYFFFTPSNPASSNGRSGNSRAANPADIEQISQMFPQIPRRDIIWDLQRNGGSVAATTERILTRGSLETPPPTFQPQIPTTSNPSTSRAPPVQKPPEHIDLIQRYNLTSKLSTSPSTTPDTDSKPSSGQQQGWSTNRNERQALLQRRREEMILNARKKLQEQEKNKAAV